MLRAPMSIALAAAGILAAGCGSTHTSHGSGPAAAVVEPVGIPETGIGLNPGLAEDVLTPEVTLANGSEPGERSPVGAPFAGGPPPIPHGIAEYDPITYDQNDCMDCHEVDKKIEGEATPIPPSHYTDLRRTPDVVGDVLVGARYNCVLCHVAPGDNEPLVENLFGD